MSDDEANRERTRLVMPASKRHPIGTPRGTSPNAAMLAVGGWLASRGLAPPLDRSWSIELALGITANSMSAQPFGTSLEICINADEWSIRFSHDSKVSTIRIVDVPCVRDRDDHQLLASTPSLKDLGAFIRKLEQRYDIRFQRQHAAVRTSLAGAEPVVLAWAKTL